MNIKNRISQIEKIAKENELNKQAQAAIDDVNNVEDSEAAFNKVLDSLIDNMDIPSLDTI